MGLEFESRAFLHVRAGDRFEPDSGAGWVVTGRRRNFFQYGQQLKWSSYAAAEEVFGKSGALAHSVGFFSLQEDYLDLSDRSRAYVLDRGRFREIEVGDVCSGEGMPPGLLQHFQWCRHCMYDSYLDCTFPEPSGRLQELLDQDSPVDVAGWFFDNKGRAEFGPLMELFPNPEIAAVTRTSGSDDPYLFVGEEQVAPAEVLLPVLEASKRVPEGRGLLFAVSPGLIRQVAVFRGEGRVLSSLQIDALPFHEDVRFATGRFGYDPR